MQTARKAYCVRSDKEKRACASLTAGSIATVMMVAPVMRSPGYADLAVNRARVPVIKAVMMMDAVVQAALLMAIVLKVLHAVIPVVGYLAVRVIQTVPRALAFTAIRRVENAEKDVSTINIVPPCRSVAKGNAFLVHAAPKNSTAAWVSFVA